MVIWVPQHVNLHEQNLFKRTCGSLNFLLPSRHENTSTRMKLMCTVPPVRHSRRGCAKEVVCERIQIVPVNRSIEQSGSPGEHNWQPLSFATKRIIPELGLAHACHAHAPTLHKLSQAQHTTNYSIALFSAFSCKAPATSVPACAADAFVARCTHVPRHMEGRNIKNQDPS